MVGTRTRGAFSGALDGDTGVAVPLVIGEGAALAEPSRANHCRVKEVSLGRRTECWSACWAVNRRAGSNWSSLRIRSLASLLITFHGLGGKSMG